ncbi:GLPGLI family protein [Riemerella anatipestifer]|uniref:GLPGLI family protein n=1 Tax=Riemerella anatipestifer TaxID=34085 RepID=A0AAP3AMS5_RIEAN|nr:GLPGLI family protein [Riemerella anatipestifer]AZZ59039.1 GLPGLI family protein [Riemerella anatipestifer]MBT0526626.1 GLPGLI family protein [Riemerella anatipestifer]MBT0528611.1 GLPGLI family protein [Riemerella anatipestifer]MBT0530452.1 GLPGLI family protein [Riemerella anatipestifer]MBT0532450.1 GLPGLI family protein [Riemerella anatipestifer]
MRTLFSLYFFISFCIAAKSQSKIDSSDIEIKYKFSYLVDTLDKKSIITEPMILIANQHKSVYYSEYYKANIDAVKKQLQGIGNGNVTIDLSEIPRAKVRHSVYRDGNEIYISNYLGRNLFTFETNDKINWIIDKNETKTILNYKCKKAYAKIGDKNYVAWYTSDIPLNDGPYKFKGLPGLILMLHDENNYFIFEIIELIRKKELIKFNQGILISKEQYLTKRREYMNDPSQGKINTPEYRKTVEENKKKYNNSLE